MRRLLRENALCASLALLGCATLAWLGLYGLGWNDYETEARPAVEALIGGHLHAFLELAPLYGGSLIERAPFALLPSLWGGGALAVYRLLALPCLLASAALGVWLVARMRAERRPRLARAVALGLIVANPITLRALELGHPEDLLGACACVAAVLFAGAPSPTRRRAIAIGVLLGLAIANKQWAVLAAGVVLLALPAGRRLPCALAAAGVAALLQAPFVLGSAGNFTTGAGDAAASGSAIFQPWQLFWFLGHHGALVHGLYGVAKPGYRVPPGWVGSVSHPLVLLAALGIALALWRRTRGRPLPAREAMLALALSMLARCLLDTWDTVYYMLPVIFALLAWEVSGDSRRPPVVALAATVAAWAQFQWLPGRLSPDLQSLIFLAWTLPLLVVLGRLLLEATAPAHAIRASERARTPSSAQRGRYAGSGRPPLRLPPAASTF